MCQKWYRKGVRGWTSGRCLPVQNSVEYPPTPPPPGGDREKEIGAKPNLNPSPITVTFCFVLI